jgi:hypothetical protein
MNQLRILHWYNVVRAHYQFTIFHVVLYALWLAR